MADQTSNGAASSISHTLNLPEHGAASLDIKASDIQGMQLNANGALVITLKSGQPVVIENFQALAQNSVTISLKDGQSIDTHTLSQTLAGNASANGAAHAALAAQTAVPTTEIDRPHAGAMVTVNLAHGQNYLLKADLEGAKVVDKGGSVVITFKDNGILILSHFDAAMSGAHAAHVLYHGQSYDLAQFRDEFHLSTETAQNNNDLDQIAKQLAGVQPAAGDNGGGVSSAGGYGFQSSVTPADLGGRAPIGPIGPTELAFGIPAFDHKVFLLATLAPTPPSITLIVNGGPSDTVEAPDAVVKENQTITVPISATLNNPSSASEALTIVVSGLPGASVGTVTVHDGGVYDAAHGTITYTLAPGQSLNTGIDFTPFPYSDVDFGQLQVTATATDAVSGTVTATTGLYVTTDAVAEVPFLNVTNESDEAGHTTVLPISTHPTDPDGSETITSVTVAGLPPGATLNHGTFNAGTDTWTLAQSDLATLTVTVLKTVAPGTYDLTVTTNNAETTLSGKEVDFTDNTNHATQTLVLTVTPNSIPVITPPVALADLEHDIGTAAATVAGHVTANFGVDGPGTITGNGAFSAGGSEKGGVLTSEGEPVTVTQTGNVYTGTASGGATVFTLTVQPNGDYSFTLDRPLDHADASNPHDVINLNFGVTATDVDGDTATGTIAINVVDDAPVAHDDTNAFNSTIGAVETGDVITGVNGGAGAADTLSHDVPNTVTQVSFGGTTVNVPAAGDAIINGDHGTLDIKADGSYTYTVTNTGTGTEADDHFTYTLQDGDGDTSSALLSLDGHVGTTTVTIIVTGNPPGGPGLPPPDSGFPGAPAIVPASGDVLVKENHSVNVGLTVNTTGSGSQTATVTLSGIDPSWGFVSHSGGVYNAAAGTWTTTLGAGASLNGAFTFTPPTYSDVDLDNLQVTATVNDPALNRTSTATDSFNIVVDAVAEVPFLSVTNEGDEAGHTTVLPISTHPVDPDGSETITSVTVTGLPAGATLNHGTFDAGTDTWTLSPSDLATLTVTVPKSVAPGTYDLTVTSNNAETNLHGKEVDFSDNTNHATQTLVLTVTPNSIPVITPPAVESVMEANLMAVTGTSVSGHVSASFGVDTPGAIAANGAFSAGGSELAGQLTSGGVAVTVAQSGNTYIGTAGGTTVFTLVLTASGDYTFTLFQPLDHADASNPHDIIDLNFGVKATDSDGDSSAATVTIHVIDDAPVAHDDTNTFYSAVGHVSGNVITGAGEQPGGADTLSHDVPNHVTSVSFGGATVAVPSTGTATIAGAHGTLVIAADGTYTYTSNGSTSHTTVVDTPHVFTGNSFPTDLAEGHAISTADQADLGELHSNMTVNANTVVTGKITFDGAGFTNSLGAFTIAADGTLQAAQMIAPSITGTGTNFSIGASSTATELGFFLVANGATTNNNYSGIDFSKGTLNFYYDYGMGDQRAAKVTDDGSHVSLVYNDGAGHNTLISGPIYFTSDRGGSDSLNSDGVVHTISGVSGTDTSTLNVAFEDLPNGGDHDYNDTVFNVQLTDHTVTDCGCGADQFNYTLTDGDGDTSTAKLNVDCIASPTITLIVNGSTDVNAPDAVVKEDHSITVPIVATLNNPSSAGEAMTVVVSGIPSTVGTVTAPGGVYDAAHGTITYTVAAGASLNAGITFTPAPNSDVDFGQLHVSATATDVATGTVSAASNLYVTTDAVADVPFLSVTNEGDEAGHTTALPISTHVTDTDGSESITSVTVTGLPAGATLNHGTFNAGTNTWTLAQTDLATLTVTVPKTVAPGTYNLTVTTNNAETTLSGKEADFSDNTNHATQTLVLTVTPNSIPVITPPAVESVMEANLMAVTGTSVSGHVSASFGVDTPGAIAANGAFSAGGSELAGHLTSGGVAVTVAQSGNTYIGTAGGTTVFTLVLTPSGDYTFTLFQPLDHADASNPHDIIDLNFGVKATDSDGDSSAATVTIHVIDDAPVAHDDVNTFHSAVGHVSGNVITGAGEQPGGADTLSHDVPNHVTSVSFGGTTVAVPTTGTASINGAHGTLVIAADGTYTYTSNGSTSHTTVVDTPHVFTGNSFPTDLAEGHAISTADQADLGEAHSNLAVNANTVVTGQITFDGAGFTNSLGVFTIAADGTLQAAQMIAPSITGAGANFSVDASTGATELGFFLVANGATTNNNYSGLNFSTGKLSFVYDYGMGDSRAATINDNGSKVSLVFTDASGHNTVIQGPVYFTSDRGGSDSLNSDGVVHTLSGVDGTDTSTLQVAFEDLPNGGDHDYNDTIFKVQLTDHTVTDCGCGADQFNYTLADGDGDTSTAKLNVDCIASPTITLIVNGSTDVNAPDAVVKEDHSITVPIMATLNNPSSAGETMTVTVSGIPSTVGTVTAPGGVYDAAHGTITYTVAAGASLNTGITFTPAPNSDVDFGQLHVTATATDASTGTVSAASNLYVTTDAVADVPFLSVTSEGDEAGHTTVLPISTHVTDTDGSESITSVTVTGLPAGATLNHGTFNAGTNTWTLAQTDLATLTVTVPKTVAPGTYNLTVTTNNAETTLSGKEADFSDNTNHATQTLVLTVTPNSVPVITAPQALSDYEHDIGTAAATVTGKVTANYGADAPGAISANGTFTSGGSELGGHLTSGGQAVNVTLNGNVYTGMVGAAIVFTLTLQPTGDYSFTLFKPLDHADASNPHDVINLNFGVQATDSDGDSATSAVTVHVVDDAPVAHDDVNDWTVSAGHATGNVITGAGEVAGGADTLSHDTPDLVTKVSFGGTTVNVPTSGQATIDGVNGELKIAADGSYTYTPFHTPGTTFDTPHVFTGNSFPTDLAEGHAISTTDRADLGELHSNMTINANTQVTGQITFDGAGYTNSLGSFTVAADGTLQAAQMIASQITGSGASFSVNAASGATELGFFLVANGYTTNGGYAGLDLTHGQMNFVYDYGQADARAAKITDDGSKVSLVFTDGSGAHVLSGPIYYTTDRGGSDSLNADGVVHTLSGVNGTDTSTMKIAFEDLPNGGDKDYNDTIFSVKLTDHTVACGCGDTFNYTLADSDGDTSNANLSIKCAMPVTASITVDNGATSDVVKEDHTIFLPVSANSTGDGTQQITRLLVDGVAPGWTVGGGWTATGTAGQYQLTLPPGQTSFSGGISLAPPANSDADLPTLLFTAVVIAGAVTEQAQAHFNLITDAVVDTPVLDAPTSVTGEWYAWSPHTQPLSGIASHVTDTDGSEQVDKILINLNNSFDGLNPNHWSLADMGATLNMGTQISKGVWEIDINAQSTGTTLNNLAINFPGGSFSNPADVAIHPNPTPDWHNTTIQVSSVVEEKHLSGAETDFSDNIVTVTKSIGFTFGLTPLVIDLNGDGFNLVDKAHGVMFDMNADGHADQTSWVAASDGLLAIDKNGDGIINNTDELFGHDQTSGFAVLAGYDSNHDGVIDAKDTDWSKLLVWQDANQDGVSQAGELHSLADLGIASISLATVTIDQTIGDSAVSDVATVTFADGHTTEVGDAWLNFTDSSMIGVGVREDGSAGNDVLNGTDNNDVLAGHGGNDVLYGGGGADVFSFDTIGKGVAEVKDFNAAQGDSLDVSALLHNVDPLTAAINNFVFATVSNGNTIVSVDQSGAGDLAHAKVIAVLDNVTGLSVEDLLHHAAVAAAA